MKSGGPYPLRSLPETRIGKGTVGDQDERFEAVQKAEATHWLAIAGIITGIIISS